MARSSRRQKGVLKSAVEEATNRVGGLDRIHRVRGILACYDFSAKPWMPSGTQCSEEAPVGWIVSDFGLNDAIEPGLLKTPLMVIRDDAVPDSETCKSGRYHICEDPEFGDDLNRRANSEELLPDLVTNGYYLLGYDSRETAKDWMEKGAAAPAVMTTVANRIGTAARIRHAFVRNRVRIGPPCLLHTQIRLQVGARAPVLRGHRLGCPAGLPKTKRVLAAPRTMAAKSESPTIGQPMVRKSTAGTTATVAIRFRRRVRSPVMRRCRC